MFSWAGGLIFVIGVGDTSRSMKFAFSFFITLLLFSASYAQQGRGLFFSAFGMDAPESFGRFGSKQAFYFEIPETEEQAVYLRVFDVDVGGRYDEQHDDFNTSTRFTIIGGKSAGKTYSGSRIINRNWPSFASSDVLYDQEFGENPGLDGHWYALDELKLNDGFKTKDGFRRFVLLVESGPGDDSNFFDLALSYSQSNKELPPDARSYVYQLSLRIPSLRVYNWDSFQGQIKLPLAGQSTVMIHTFDMDDVPISVEVPFRGSVELYTSGDGEWVSNTLSVPEQAQTDSLGLNFFGRNFNNTFGLIFTDTNEEPLRIPLPIRDYVPPKVKPIVVDFSVHHDSLDCRQVLFSLDESNLNKLRNPQIRWMLGNTSYQGAQHRLSFDSLGYQHYELAVSGFLDARPWAFSYADSILINQEPFAWAGGNRVSIPGDYITFDGTVSEDLDGKITKYLWDFGDGNTGEGARIDHIYKKAGLYTVSLTVFDDTNTPCNQATASALVKVNKAPIPRIIAPSLVQLGETFLLDGQESIDEDGSIIRYEWEIGNDTTLLGSQVEYALKDGSNLPVRLSVIDDSEAKNAKQETQVLIKINQPPIAIAGDDKVVSPNRPATFDASRSFDPDGTLINYEWDFGDGNRKVGSKIDHGFDLPGTYQVTLKVTDNSERALGVDTMTVVVNSPPEPVISGNLLADNGLIELAASESFDADGEIISYAWRLSDGRNFEGDSIRFVIQEPGKTDVELTVVDNSGTFSALQRLHKTLIVNAPPKADFSAPEKVATNSSVHFDATSSVDPDGEVTKYLWDFGDGNTSAGQKTEHRFQEPGIYQVKLAVFDNTNLPSAYDYTYKEIRVNATPNIVVKGPTSVSEGQTFELSLTESYDPDGQSLRYFWNWEGQWVEGEPQRGFVASKKVGSILLRVQDDAGLANSVSEFQWRVPFNQEPIAVAQPKNFRGVENLIVFDGTQSSDPDGDELRYYWDFGDGKSAEGPIVLHNYRFGGFFVAKLTVDDQKGMDNSLSMDSTAIFINRAPEPFFEIPQVICVKQPFDYDASSSFEPDETDMLYEWNFGDGNSAQSKSGVHEFEDEGSYVITLTVDDTENMANSRASFSQTVAAVGAPIANAGDDLEACSNQIISFDASQSQAADEMANEYLWDFGDGNVGFGMRPTHVFSKPGTYEVKLTIRGRGLNACSKGDSDIVQVAVHPEPKAVFDIPNVITVTDQLVLDASNSIVEGQDVRSFSWYIADSISIDWNLENIPDENGLNQGVWVKTTNIYSPTEYIPQSRLQTGLPITKQELPIGSYEVRLEVRGGMDCNPAQAYRFVQVLSEPVLSISEAPVLIPGQSFSFSAQEAQGRINMFNEFTWDFGDGNAGDGYFVAHAFEQPGVYTIRLNAFYGKPGAFQKKTTHTNVIVNAAPQARIEGPSRAFPGVPLRWDASSSTDIDGKIISYEWRFSDGWTDKNPQIQRTFENEGVYTLTLTVKDDRGVSNSISTQNIPIQIDETPSLSFSLPEAVCVEEPTDLIGSLQVSKSDLKHLELFIADKKLDLSKAGKHTFNFPGSYAIRAKLVGVAGLNGMEPSTQKTIIANAPPQVFADVPREISIGPANSFAVFDASKSFDPNGDRINYYWDLGDGTRKSGKIVRHEYQRTGSYTVTLELVDSRNMECSRSSVQFNIEVK